MIARYCGTHPSVRPSAIQCLVVRGVELRLDIQGVGPSVLFVHGFPLDRTTWRDLIATLTGWRCVAPDLRGLGLSHMPDEPCSMSEYADDLAALLELLQIDKAVVCGLSMGGYIAFELLRRHRKLVRALILMNTRAESDPAEVKRQRDEMIRMVQEKGTGALADRLVPLLLAPGSLSAMPQVVEHLKAMISGNPAAGVVGALEAMKARSDSTALLSRIDVPTLVVAGSDDQLIPGEHSRSLAQAIPGARFALIPEAGHLTPMEQPTVTGRAVGEFLRVVS